MSDSNIERQKSYRWVSASKVSYDGLGWNSSDDNPDDKYTYYGDNNAKNDSSFGGNKIQDHFDKLPASPKLNYSDKDSLYESPEEDIENQQYNNGIKDIGSLSI